jgi:hypothetical protein
MRKRRKGSVIAYSMSVLFGLLGVGLCCFFGFGEVSSPNTSSDISFLLIAVLMILLAAFGYRGLKEHRTLGDEIWWQVLIAGLICAGFLVFAGLFIFICIVMLSAG